MLGNLLIVVGFLVFSFLALRKKHLTETGLKNKGYYFSTEEQSERWQVQSWLT